MSDLTATRTQAAAARPVARHCWRARKMNLALFNVQKPLALYLAPRISPLVASDAFAAVSPMETPNAAAVCDPCVCAARL
jgi:hypothetical protein